MKPVTFVFLWAILSYSLAAAAQQEKAVEKKEDKKKVRQMEYLSLLNTLLQQTNLLSSFDGVLLAATTLLSSGLVRMKPLLMASSLSYMMYVGAAMVFPGPLARMGLPTLEAPDPKMMARSFEGSTARMFDGLIAETLTKGMRMSPIMSIVTNVTVTVVSDTMSRLRMLSRMLMQQLSLIQGNMVWFGRALSNECIMKFMCRVGQVTYANFPTAASILRTVADSYPGMDDFAVAVARGTSSTNCSTVYPECSS